MSSSEAFENLKKISETEKTGTEAVVKIKESDEEKIKTMFQDLGVSFPKEQKKDPLLKDIGDLFKQNGYHLTSDDYDQLINKLSNPSKKNVFETHMIVNFIYNNGKQKIPSNIENFKKQCDILCKSKKGMFHDFACSPNNTCRAENINQKTLDQAISSLDLKKDVNKEYYIITTPHQNEAKYNLLKKTFITAIKPSIKEVEIPESMRKILESGLKEKYGDILSTEIRYSQAIATYFQESRKKIPKYLVDAQQGLKKLCSTAEKNVQGKELWAYRTLCKNGIPNIIASQASYNDVLNDMRCESRNDKSNCVIPKHPTIPPLVYIPVDINRKEVWKDRFVLHDNASEEEKIIVEIPRTREIFSTILTTLAVHPSHSITVYQDNPAASSEELANKCEKSCDMHIRKFDISPNVYKTACNENNKCIITALPKAYRTGLGYVDITTSDANIIEQYLTEVISLKMLQKLGFAECKLNKGNVPSYTCTLSVPPLDFIANNSDEFEEEYMEKYTELGKERLNILSKKRRDLNISQIKSKINELDNQINIEKDNIKKKELSGIKEKYKLELLPMEIDQLNERIDETEGDIKDAFIKEKDEKIKELNKLQPTEGSISEVKLEEKKKEKEGKERSAIKINNIQSAINLIHSRLDMSKIKNESNIDKLIKMSLFMGTIKSKNEKVGLIRIGSSEFPSFIFKDKEKCDKHCRNPKILEGYEDSYLLLKKDVCTSGSNSSCIVSYPNGNIMNNDWLQIIKTIMDGYDSKEMQEYFTYSELKTKKKEIAHAAQIGSKLKNLK